MPGAGGRRRLGADPVEALLVEPAGLGLEKMDENGQVLGSRQCGIPADDQFELAIAEVLYAFSRGLDRQSRIGREAPPIDVERAGPRDCSTITPPIRSTLERIEPSALRAT